MMVNSWESQFQISGSSLLVTLNHQLLVQWPSNKESTEFCASFGRKLKGTDALLPLEKPMACPHPVSSPALGKAAAVRGWQPIG